MITLATEEQTDQAGTGTAQAPKATAKAKVAASIRILRLHASAIQAESVPRIRALLAVRCGLLGKRVDCYLSPRGPFYGLSSVPICQFARFPSLP
jgi:hypothetical protein